MKITEKGLYEAFGIEPPADGGQAQEIADPAQEPGGAQAQELADPEAVVTESPTDDDAPEAEAGLADDEHAGEHPNGEKAPLTLEQRRANAARRRQEETQAAVDKALAEERTKHQAQLAGIFKGMGLVDPESGKTVETLEQYQAFQRNKRNADLQQKFKDGTATHEDIAAVVTDVMQDQQIQPPQQPVQQEDQAATQQRINDEMAQIMELDKSIKSVGDLVTMPGAKEFREKVNRGYSLIDAFRLVRGPALEQAKTEAARQAAMNNLRGKAHMNAVGSPRGAGAVSVPKDEMDMYRLFNPGATDAQIQAHYNKNRK